VCELRNQGSTTPRQTNRLGVIVIGRKRPGFDQEWSSIVCSQALNRLEELGFECIGHNVRAIDVESISAVIGDIRRHGATTLVVLQPSIGNGQLAVTVAQQWQKPILLWATPERPDVETVSSCSLVGQHLWASILRGLRHPFEIVVGDAADSAVLASVRKAINISRATTSIREAKLGVVGSSAPGFIPLQADYALLSQQLCTQLQMLSLVQFIERVQCIDQRDVAADIEQVRQLRIPMDGVGVGDLAANCRYYLAIRQTMAEERLDALALQCWPELPQYVGHWPYLAVSRLVDDGVAVSMEGDADGALLCLAAKYIDAGAGFIADWLEHDSTTITLWHGGTAPLSMCYPIASERGPWLGTHFNFAKPLVVNGELRTGEPVTIARLWRCDARYHMTAFEGVTVPPWHRLTGNWARIELDGPKVPELFDALCHAGMPHHPIMFYGRHADSFHRLARMMGVHWIEFGW
jgi:L-fucose isomerase-like protein